MSGEHLSRYSEKLNLTEHRERLKERRKFHSKSSISLPPKYRCVNTAPIIDIYSKSTLNIKSPRLRDNDSPNRLNLDEVHLSLNLLQLDPVDRIVLRVADERDAMQKRTFENWINSHLSRINKKIDDIFYDLRDGIVLLKLLEVLSNQKLLIQNAYSRFHCLENINTVLNFLRSQNIKLVNIHADDLVDGNPKLTLGLVWIIILFFQFKEIVKSNRTDDLSVKQILLQWSKKSLKDYPDIKIENFSTSWKDGKAFLALIHKHRPDLIDYRSVSRNSPQQNLEMAFNTAQEKLGVPKIIDPEDVLSGNIDEKSMMTYVASLFELTPKEDDIEQKIYHFRNEYADLYTNLNSALDELNEEFRSSNLDLDLSQSRLENNYANFQSQYDSFQVLYNDIAKSKSFSNEFQKKFHVIASLWSKFETNSKEKSLIWINESKKIQRSEKISKSLEAECINLANFIEDIKFKTRKIPILLPKTPVKEMNEYLYNISRELYETENQINNMIISVQELRRDGYPADQHYRKIINMSGVIDKVKKEFEKLSPPSLSSEFVRPEHYTPMRSMSFEDESSFPVLRKWMIWIEEKSAMINEINFSQNIDDLRKIQDQFTKIFEEIENSVDEFKRILESDDHKTEMDSYQSKEELKSKFNQLWTNCSTKEGELKSYYDFLLKTNESLKWIKLKEEQQINWQWFDTDTIKLSEKQERFKNLIDELEMKETSINETIAVGTTLTMHNHSATNLIQRSLTVLKGEWQWILNLTHCLKTHLETLAIYEQFFYEAQEADYAILELTDQLNTRYFRPMGIGLDEGEVLNREIRDMMDTIDDFKDTINRLIANSQNISALALRTTSVLPDKKINVKAICSSKEDPDSYSRQFTEGECLQLLNNASPFMWKVCNSRNEIIHSPAICFLITDMSPQAAQTATTLDSHFTFLKDLWSKRELQLREQVLYATIDIVRNWTVEDFCTLDPCNRKKIVEILNQDANRLIMDLQCAKNDENETKRFQSALNECNAKFAELAHNSAFTVQMRNAGIELAANVKSVDRDSLTSVELQLDDLINVFMQMQFHLESKLASQVVMDVNLLEEQVCKHKEFETELKNYENQVNELIGFIKTGSFEADCLKPKLEKMVDLWETLWNEAHMFVIKLKSTEVFFSQLDEIDQIICETELTLINQNEAFPAGMDQIKIMIAQLEAAQENISSVLNNLQEAPSNLDKLINAVTVGRQNQIESRFDDIQKLKKELKSVEYRYDLLKTQIKKRLNHVNECCTQYISLKNELKSIQIWIIGLQTTVKSQIHVQTNVLEPKNVELMEKKINNFLSEINSYKIEIDEINKTGTYFLNLLQKYEDLFKNYQNEIQNQVGSNNQDYYGYSKRSRIQNARDWVTIEINKLNTDFNNLSQELTNKQKEYKNNASKQNKLIMKIPKRINTFETQEIEINKFRQLNKLEIPQEPFYYRSTKLPYRSNNATEIISNLNRCQLSNLWYFSNLLSENFSPISVGDCFRFRCIRLDSNISANLEDEQSLTLEDSFKDGRIMKKTYNILTSFRIFNRNQNLSIMEMMKLNIFNIFNGVINIDCFSEPLSISKAISANIIDTQLGALLNCLMISSVELIHSPPTVIYAIYSAEELKTNPPMLSISDSVDLNFFHPISDHLIKFVDPILKTELNYSEAIRQKYIDDSLSEISITDSLDNDVHISTKEAIKNKIFDAEYGNIFDHQINSEIPIHYARQEGILSKPSSILQMILEKNELSFMHDAKNEKISISEALKKGLIDGNSQFSIKPDFSKTISISDAISRGVITNEGNIFVEKDNTYLSFLEAFNKGIIKISENITSGPNHDIIHPSLNFKLNLSEAINSGIIEPKTGEFFDTVSKEWISLQHAFERKLLTKSLLKDLSVYCGIKNEENVKLNILQAINQDLLDIKFGLIRNSSQEQWVSLKDALDQQSITENQYNRIVFLTCPLIRFSISIDEIATNLDQTEFKLFENRKLYKTITGVYDSTKNEYISLEEAQKRNFINDDMGVYYDEQNNICYSFTDAIDDNLIQIDTKKSKEKILEIKAIKSEKIKSYSITSVFNSITNQWVSAREAVEDGIVDHLSGNYKAINEYGFEIEIPINEAISAGFIKAFDEVESLVNDEYKILGFKHPISGEILNPDEAIDEGLVDKDFETFYDGKNHRILTINEAKDLGLVLTESLDHLESSKPATINELITTGLIDFDTGSILFPNEDEILSLNDSIDCGRIDIDRSMLKHPDTGNHICLREAIETELFDPSLCTIKDNYNNIITLQDAVNEGLFPEHVPTVKGRITFEEALEQGYIDLKTNIFRDPRSNLEYAVEDAMSENLLDHPQSNMSVCMTNRLNVVENKTLAMPNEEDLVDTRIVQTLESIQRNYPGEKIDCKSITSVRDTSENRDISLSSAIHKGIIKFDDNSYIDQITGNQISLEMACKLGLVVSDSKGSLDSVRQPKLASFKGSTNNTLSGNAFYIIDPTSGKKLSVEEAIKQNIYDPVEKRIRSRINNNYYSWEDSIKLGYIVYSDQEITNEEEKILQRNCIVYNFYYIHKGLGVPAKLTDQMVRENHIDPINYTIKDPKTGTTTTLTHGLENGSVFATIITLTNKSLYFENLDKRHDNYQIISVYDPSLNQLISYNDAINNGIINIVNSTYTNSKTKEISTMSEAMQYGLLHTIMKTRQYVPLSYPFTNVHIRTIEEEMNFSIPQHLPEDILLLIPERNKESKRFEELSNKIIPSMMDNEAVNEKLLQDSSEENLTEIFTNDAPNVARKYIKVLKDESENLSEIERKLLKETTIYLNEKENQLLLDECQDINNEFLSKQAPILSLIHQIEKFISKKYDNIPADIESELQHLASNLKTRANQVQTEINNRSRLLISIIDEFDQFFNRLNDCKMVHEKLEQSIDLICKIELLENLEKSIADMKSLDHEFASYHNDIRLLNNSKLKFLDKINKFEANRQKFSKLLSIIPPQENSALNIVHQEINESTNEIVTRCKDIQQNFKMKLMELEETFEDIENLKEKQTNIDEINSKSEFELNDILSRIDTPSGHALLPYLNDIHRINGEIFGINRIVKSITDDLPGVIKRLEAIGITRSNADDFITSIQSSIDNFNAICETLKELLNNVNQQSISSDDATFSIQDLEQWLHDIDSRIREVDHLSLDQKTLSEQEVLIQTLIAEINSRHQGLENVLKSNDTTNEKKGRELEERINNKSLVASSILEDINELRKSLDSFHSRAKSCSDWITMTTELLSDRMFIRLDNEKFQDKLEETKKEFDMKQKDIDELKLMANKILSQSNVKDQLNIENPLEKIEKVWSSLSDLMVTREKELRDREKYSEKYSVLKAKIIDKLSNWEQTLSSNVPLAIDLLTLRNQNEENDCLIKDWNISKSEINEFCILGSEYDSILQGFPLSGDQHYRINSPQKKPSRIRAGHNYQSPTGSAITKAMSHQPSALYSGSESSGVSSADYVHLNQEYSEVILEIDDVKSRYSEIGDRLLNRKNDISSLLTKCESFDQELQEFSEKLDTHLKQLISTPEKEFIEKEDEMAYYEKIDENVRNLRPTLANVLANGNDLLRNKELVPGGVELKSNLNILEKKFNTLKDTSKKQLNLRRNLGSEMKKFSDMKKTIESNIMRKERMINVLGPVGTSVSYGNVQLEQVNALIDEVEGLKNDVSQLRMVGEDIIKTMSPNSLEKEDIESAVDTLSQKVDSLHKLLKDRELSIHSIMGPSKDFYKLLNSVSDQLMTLQDKIEKSDENVLVSFDWEELQSELDNIKALLQECENLSKPLLSSTSDENTHYEIKNKVSNLSRYCREIQWKIDHSVNMIGKRCQQEENILNKIEEIEQWVDQKKGMIKELSVERDDGQSDLPDNIRQLQILQGDCKHKKSQVNDLHNEINRINEEKSPSHKSKQIYEKLDAILSEIKNIEIDADNLGSSYQQASIDLNKINTEGNKIEAWIDIEKHKMNKQYPVGLESLDSEVRLLESTIQSLENKHQQVQDLKRMISPSDNVDSKNILFKNVSGLDKIESNLNDLQIEAVEKLEFLKKLHEQITSSTENLNYLKSSAEKFETEWDDITGSDVLNELPTDITKLEKEINQLKANIDQVTPDLTATKSLISNIANLSPVNAHLLEPELDKLVNRYEALSNKIAHKLAYFNSQHKAMNECKNRVEILATRQKNLNEKVDNFPQSSLDLDSLEDQIQDLSNLAHEVVDIENNLKNMKREVKILANKKIEGGEKLIQKIEGLNSANELIMEMIDDRQNSIRLQHNLVTEFESKKNEFNRKIDEIKNDPEYNKLVSNSSKNIKLFTAQKINPLKKQLEEVIDIGNKACSTVVSGLGFKHIEQEMEQVKHNFDKLMQSISDIENNVDRKLMREQKFDTTLKNLNEFVDSMSKDLKTEEEPSIEYHKAKSQLNSHRLLLDYLKKRQSSLDELNKIGSELIVNLNDPQRSKLDSDLKHINKKYDDLLNIAEEKNCRYDRAVKLSKTFKDYYEPSLIWLDTTEKNLANFDTSPTVDASEMEKRIQEYQSLVEEIKAHELTLDNLDEIAEDLIKISSSNDSAAIKNKISTLRSYYEEISEKAMKKMKLFENSMPIAERFLHANSKLDLVLPSLTALVRENDAFTGPVGERNMGIIENETNAVEKLVSQARNDLDQLKRVDVFENSLEKVEDLFVENEKRFKDVLNEVTKKATKIGSNRTKAKIQEEKLDECLEIMLDYANKISAMSDKINNDYTDLDECKIEFKSLLSSWNEHKEAINTTVNESKKLMRQAPGTDLKSLRSAVDRVKKQSQSLTKSLENQQLKLDDAIPLVKEYTMNYNTLKDWLVETEENMYQNKINNLDPDQLHKAEQEIKALANSWEDQKPLLDSIIKTGQPLSQIVNRVQGKNILAEIEDAKKRYNNIKEFIKTRATDLEDILLINTELNEKVDQCANNLENIRDRVSDCFQPSVHPEKLEEELGIFDEIVHDLDKLQVFVDKLRLGIENCSPTRKKFDDSSESADILEKLGKISESNKSLRNQSSEYKDKIQQLLKSANEFWNSLNDTEDKFKKITLDLTNIIIEDLDSQAVNEKKMTIEYLQNEINMYGAEVEKIVEQGSELIKEVNNPNETPDVEQAMEELRRNFDNVQSISDGKVLNIEKQQSLITKLEEMRIKIDEWFREQQNRLSILGPLPTETNPVLTQIEKTKELKIDIEPKHRDIEMINQLGYQITKGSHPTVKTQVDETLSRINESWARLLDGLGQRQHQLQCILLSLGEFHRAVDEFIEWIISTEKSLSNIKIEHGDINSLEMGLAQHKMIRADMNIQQASISKIERKAAEIIQEDVSSLSHEATSRLEQLNKAWDTLKAHIRTKHIELEDALKEALIFYGDQQEITKNIEELGKKLDTFTFSGSLPDTAKEQLKRFIDIYRTFPKLGTKIDRFVEDAKEIESKSSASVKEVINNDTANVVKIWNVLKSLAESRKARLEKAIESVESFHLDLGKFINWLTITEKNLNQQRPVSRLVSTILDQMEAHRALKRDITSHREEMLNLDKMATHLKYISQKHDIVLIRNLMSSIHHRWEKVVSRSSERSRNLDYGYKEAKRFEDMNKNLLDDIAQKLALLEQDMSIGQTPPKIREQIANHKEFHCSLGEHNFTYDATRRLGYQLRDKAPIQECKKIDEIVHNLQMKWQNLCNKSIEREKALNDALLICGSYKDAMDNLLSWLRSIEPKLSDTSKGCCGDINTVQNLLAEHSNLEKQLRDRESMVEKINTDAMKLMVQSEEDSTIIEDQLAELKSSWSNINNLAKLRRKRLEDALQQALQFESQWGFIKDLFAKSEHELRQFTLSPEEEKEEIIQQMIANHSKFHQSLIGNETRVNNFQQFGHEILASAYPDAENPIKHYINIIKSQWTELLGWSEQRGQNLREHLYRVNERKILLDDLLLWLATAEGTLVASENRDNPCSLTEAKFQLEEHERFISDMTRKQKDHDEIVTNSKKKSSLPVPMVDKNRRKDIDVSHSMGKSQEAIFINPKVNQLHSKWKQVWFMILNRSKRLADHIEYLKEVENMKNFSFDDWRRRYMNWMNHSKSRVMDFFRRQDTDHDGRVTRKEFIDGIIDSKFQTTRVEMEVVADIFDKQKSGYIDYRQFLAALRPDREIYQTKPGSENEIIHDEVKKQISKCTCNNPYKITQCGDGKYKFGETEKLRLVRILRSNVMVRIGGGWCALDEFLVKHDPCRESFVPEPLYDNELSRSSKGRTNYELREKLSHPKGAVITMAPFKFKPQAVSLPVAPKVSASSKITSPRIPTSSTTPKKSTSAKSPRTPASVTSPEPQRRSRIPTRTASSHHSSRDPSPK